MSNFVKQTMGVPGWSRSLRYSSIAWLAGLAACTSVLGIEDLHEGPRAEVGGTENGAGSSSSGAGKSNAGGNGTSGTSNPNGGASNPSGGASNPSGGSVNPEGGVGNEAGGGSLSEGGGGGAPEPVDGPVHGTVIDFWGRGLGNVSVKVGDQTVVTDKDGKFTADAVPAEYDASLTLSRETGDKIYGWVYQGLTRRDPTLQVYQAREDRYTLGYVFVSDTTLAANDTISASIGTADGNTEKKKLDTGVNGNYFSPNWQGPATTNGTIHALQWTVNQASSLPSAYKTYFSALVALAEGTNLADTTLKMKGPVSSGTITGTAAPAGEGDRNNGVFLRFSSGGSIRLANHTPTTDAFSYIVPQVASASISVTASEGDSSEAFGFVHKDGLSPGDAAATLAIPAPATPLSPVASGDMVDQTTPFTFNGSADSKGAFVIHVEASKFYQSFYIVTSKKKLTLPVAAGYSWVGGRGYYWRVETFGSFATVDQMAGPTGFADPYYGPTQSTSTGEPQGLKQDSGSFTLSRRAYFTYNCVAGQTCVMP